MSVANIAVVRIVESLDKLNNRGLSAPASTNESNSLVLGHLDINFFNNFHLRFCWIMELNIFKGDGPIVKRILSYLITSCGLDLFLMKEDLSDGSACS